MATIKEVKIPDLGNISQAEVIEVSVKPGDTVKVDDALITLESDKASMDIPAPFAGTIKEIKVKTGTKVSSDDLILTMEVTGETTQTATAAQPAKTTTTEPEKKSSAAPAKTTSSENSVTVPDLGNVADAAVIEILVKPGDKIAKDAGLVTLESDKASMEIPAPFAGVVKELKVKIGDKVASGHVIAIMQTEVTEASAESKLPVAAAQKMAAVTQTAPTAPVSSVQPVEKMPPVNTGTVHAGPAVRRLAREFGIDLTRVTATGPKNRVLKEDIQNYVKNALARSTSNNNLGLPSAPVVDFTQFGPITAKPLSRIKKLTAANLHRNWLLVPHVTQFDEADITELEAFRKSLQAESEKQGVKLTPLAFIMKAVVMTLREFPQFNASLDQNGEQLIFKDYYHIGVAVDTPDGLVVPVIRDVYTKGLMQLARELGEISAKARKKALAPSDMQGATFTISSLGGIGGTAFTPIINLPNVAILGVSKAAMKPIYQNGQFVPRLMLPLSLSYDHRVIDGAEGARFIVYLTACLSDIRRWVL